MKSGRLSFLTFVAYASFLGQKMKSLYAAESHGSSGVDLSKLTRRGDYHGETSPFVVRARSDKANNEVFL